MYQLDYSPNNAITDDLQSLFKGNFMKENMTYHGINLLLKNNKAKSDFLTRENFSV